VTAADSDPPVKILYVLGRGRSGSTIFANALGELDGFFSAGEVRDLFDPVLRRPDSMCACGEPVRDCPVWAKVLARLPEVDIDEVARWQHDVVRERRVYRLLRRRPGEGRHGGQDWAALTAYARLMSQVYEALADVTGARVIVDASKRPSYGLFLQHVAGCEPYYVHIVRDPRASAYSWKSRRYVGSAGDTVAQRGAVDATLRWDVLNLGAEATLRSVPSERRIQIRYEDFAAEPRETVERIATFVGEGGGTTPFAGERTIELGTNHTIAGNPSRQRIGRIEIRDDEDWRVRSSRLDRWLATAVALPLLPRYGYRLRSGAGGPGDRRPLSPSS
jgi:hypothetical protein